MAIREHCGTNSPDNGVPSEVIHLVSNIFGWYELVSYHSSMDGIDLRFFEKVNHHWVEVQRFAGCGGERGIVLKRKPEHGGGGMFTGGVKRFTQMYLNDQAQILSDATGIKMPDKDDGTPRTFSGDSREVFNYDSNEKIGSDIVKASAAATVGLTAAKFLTSGLKAFKDPDTWKTIKNGFKGKIGKNFFDMPDMPIKKITYKKRAAAETAILRKEFNSTKRGKFAESLADNPDKIRKLKDSGFSDKDILKLKNKKLPDGYQVHHKLPIDDSGTNDPSNFILIKYDPHHKTITNYQNGFAKSMKDGDIIEIEFPVPKGTIYPLTK